MSKSNINDLPIEILLNVFCFLDKVQWQNAALTCKLWNSLIESSCRWTLRLHYDIHDHPDKQRINFILTTNRKFGTIELWGSHFSKCDEILRIIQRHGINVVKLCWHGGHMSMIVFAERLNLMPNLKYVYLHKTFFLDECGLPSDQVLPELRKLKEMVLFYSDHRIVKCFEKAKPRKLKIAIDTHFKDCTLLVDFLKSRDTLTSLCTLALFKSKSVLVEMGRLETPIPIKLTELSISETILKRSSNAYVSILRFLKSQAANLKRIQIRIGFPSYVYEFVLANLTNLDTLNVLVGHIPREKELYNRLGENLSVRTLILCGLVDVHNYKFVPYFLKKLPNIQSLILPDGYGKKLRLVKSLGKLESISIGYITERSFLDVQFPNLKTLQIRSLPAKVNWHEFTKVHKGLTELTIGSIRKESFLVSDDIDQITTNAVNLQTLRLGAGFKADESFFEIIRVKCTNLKVFDLHKSCIPCGLTYSADLLRLCDEIKCSKYFSL